MIRIATVTLGMFVFVFAGAAHAANHPSVPDKTPEAPAKTIDSVTPPAPSERKIFGSLDMRPSWYAQSGKWGTEEVAEIGFQFRKTLLLSVWQEFTTNLYNSRPAEQQGLNFVLGRTMVRTRVSQLVKRDNFSLNYENRTYLPTASSDQADGMLAISRNYLKFNFQLTKKVLISLQEILIPNFYSRAGNGSAANPAFENRVYAVLSLDITPKLNLAFPLLFNQTRYRAYAADTTNNNSWAFKAWIYPELDYTLTKNLTVGLSYYSDNLIKPDFSGLALADGLAKGAFQFVTIVML